MLAGTLTCSYPLSVTRQNHELQKGGSNGEKPFTAKTYVVTGDHLDVHAELHGALNGGLGVGAGRVQEGEDADHVEGPVTIGLGNAQAADAAAAKVVNDAVELLSDLLLLV